MGAKTWMLVISDGNVAEKLKSSNQLDKKKTIECLNRIFPNEKLEEFGIGDLSFTNPPKDEIYAGYFNGVFIVAAEEFGVDCPSKIENKFIDPSLGSYVQLHAMHSAVDWFAYAIWENNSLVRALSLSPDSGILENKGEKQRFEVPYWNGDHPAIEPEDMDEDEEEYPFKFHPLELAEEALKNMFGYQLEGVIEESQIQPEDFPLLKFKRKLLKKWWQF